MNQQRAVGLRMAAYDRLNEFRVGPFGKMREEGKRFVCRERNAREEQSRQVGAEYQIEGKKVSGILLTAREEDATMGKVFAMGDVKAEPGERRFGWLKLANTYYGELSIPLIVVNGLSSGKKLLLNSGVHGTEYVGTDAILRLVHEIDPRTLRGTLVAIPFLNIPAFERISREGPFDSLNLNRIFPGKEVGFLSEQIAHLAVKEIFPKVDYAIDLHGATMNDMQIYICGYEECEKFSALDMAKAFGIEALWKLSTSGIRGSFSSAATELGVPTIVVEVGGEGRCKEEWVQFEIRGFKNVMKMLGMLEGKPEKLLSQHKIVEGFWQHSHAGGFLRPHVNLGDQIKKGTVMGTVINLHGKVLEELKTPVDGLVLGMRTLPKINPGDWSFWVGVVKEEIKA